MCGIVGGWFQFPSQDALMHSVKAFRHRGPDGHGQYIDQESGVMLGHVRLAIIDLSSTGHQPMLSAEAQVALVFNGEIYNYRELRSELEADGHLFLGNSDTEVLLRLYLKCGVAALPRLGGIFTLAIYDERTGDLILARDALGVKPLYFGEGTNGFAFASEVKALLPLLGPVRTLDLQSLHRYVTFLWCPGEGTPILEVRKLLPGEALVVKNGRIVRRWSWYELPARRGITGHMGETDSIAAVRAGLRLAVHRQLVADVPVGAFLSGGLDSSAIVAFARELAPSMRCFTIEALGGGDAGEFEDLPYARRVAKHLNVALDVVQVDASRMASSLEKMVWQLDEPLADPAPLNVLYISQLARQQGIKVLLSGSGGDDLFTGYRRHLALRYENLWSWLPKAARNKLGVVATGIDQRGALGRRLGRLFRNATESGDEGLAGYFAWARREDLSGPP